LAEYYDRIYWWKDYNREVEFLLKIFRRYGVRGKRILEVACGTGNHTKILPAGVMRKQGWTSVKTSYESLGGKSDATRLLSVAT
jgi:ubiquinone/menaquinone biosynthesis C-methylase UbiE